MRNITSFILAATFIGSAANAQLTFSPAPRGEPKTVAAAVIRKAGHPCPSVASAKRQPDGGITAACSNGELYLIATVNQVGPVALRCSAAKRLLKISCHK